MASQLLFHAVNQGDIQQCQCLIVEACADVNYRNTLGETALHVAVMRGLPSVTELLLASGADPNIAQYPSLGGRTPLHITTEKGFLRVAELLLDYSASPNP
eukprot:Rhum_TRINITY_DN3502_c0_g1::Rhum_TRINITY_DN3502_c0_g1_i1::g.11037::m.11037